MNNRLKPYEEYKETGRFWLETLPSHWDCEKLGNRFRERRIKVSDKDFVPLSVTKKGIVPQLSTAAKSNDGDNRKLVRSGDFVINSRSDRKGSSGLSKLEGSVSLINTVLQPIDIVPKYTHYLLRSFGFIEEFYRNGRGIVADLWTTRFFEMRNINIPLPPKKEQDQIVRYLDTELSKINKFIKAKKKQIELLKEQKQAIINQAVTKGIDPDAKMKSSGIDWLGDIPEGWEVLQLRRVTKEVQTGGTPQGANEKYYEDDGFDWFTPGDFNDTLYLKNSTRQLSKLGKKTVSTFPANTIMMIGIGGTMGKVSISEGECSCNQQINAIICNKLIETKYLTYYLRAKKQHIFNTAKYTTLPILNQEETKKIPVLSFCNNEQRQITTYIENKTDIIDKSIEAIKQEIELVTEYRTTLISNVVTGKVDVRHIEVEDIIDSIEEDFEDLDEGELSEELEMEEE